MNNPEDGRPEAANSVLAKVAAGFAVAAAGTRLGPEAAIVLGGGGYLFESLAEQVREELRPQARRREAQLLSTAAEEVGCDAEQLGQLIGGSESTVLQAGIAMAAAQRTAWPPQVRALGRELAAGLIASDEAEVNVRQLALAAMADMGRMHVLLLDLLVRHIPGSTAEGLVAIARPEPAYPGAPDLGPVWTTEQILAVRPKVCPAFTSVIGTLQRHGLTVQTDRTPEVLEQLGKNMAAQVNKQAVAARRGQRLTSTTLRAPTISKVERSWSATELGAEVLSFYDEAGTEADSSPVPCPGSS